MAAPRSQSRSPNAAIRDGGSTYRRRRNPFAGGRPSHPLSSPTIQILRAVVDGEVGSWAMAWTTILRVSDRQERLDRLALGQPDDPRVLLDHEDGLARLLGFHDPQGRWMPGLAGLSDRQARFLELQLAGYTAAQISFMEGRKKGSMAVPLDLSTVYSTLSQARAKVRRLLAPYYGLADVEVEAAI